MKHYLFLLLTLITNLHQIIFYSSKPTYTFRTTAQSISGSSCIQSSLWVFASCYKRPSYLQMWRFCDRPAEGEEIRARRLVRNYESWQETHVEGSATCRASCSVSKVSTVNWSTDEGTRATEREGVTSAVYLPSALCQCGDCGISV